MKKDFDVVKTQNLTTIKKAQKLSGTTMLTILFILFTLIIGITAGVTYSAFQNTAQSNGTLSFAINGHQGTLDLSNTKVANYNSTDLTLIFTLASDTGYNNPTITNISMGGSNLTKESTNFKNGSNIIATYSSSTLTIYRAEVTGVLIITGSSTASTYTITYNSNGGSGTMADTTANYNSQTTLRANAFTRTGYSFLGWATTAGGDMIYGNNAPVLNLGDTTLYAKWSANELTFNNQNKSVTFSSTAQNITYTGASNGTGSYRYDITAGNDDNYFSVSGTTITAVANAPVGSYNLAITATDDGSSKTRTVIIAITINPIMLGTPTVSISNIGVVTWNTITGASSYDISIDGTTWTTGVSSGYDYFNTIVAGSGTRTVRVRANPSANYDASKIGSASVMLYTVTISVSGYGTVSASSRNVISGSAVSVSNNILYFAGKQGVTPTVTDATGYTTTFTSWSKTSGTITSTQTITATFTRTAKSYTVTSGKSAYTSSIIVASSGTFGSGLSISWVAGNEVGYTYSLSHVKVYSGTSTSGTLLATYTSGTSATFTMTGTYYSSIYIYVTHTRSVKTYTVTSGKSSYTNTLTVAASGTFNSGLSISWSAGSATGYTYSFSHVKVYSGTSTSGTLLATYTSGTSATFTMNATTGYYSSIYVYATHTRTANTLSLTINSNSAGQPYHVKYSVNTFCTDYNTIYNDLSSISLSSSGTSNTYAVGNYDIGTRVYIYVYCVNIEQIGVEMRITSYSGLSDSGTIYSPGNSQYAFRAFCVDITGANSATIDFYYVPPQ